MRSMKSRGSPMPGLSGLKLHPSMHGYHVADHGLLDPVFEKCEKHGLPVLDQRAGRCVLRAARDRRDRAQSSERADDHCAHGRGVECCREAIIVAERHEHIYLETSATLLADVRRA